jgi:hypothetical protein
VFSEFPAVEKIKLFAWTLICSLVFVGLPTVFIVVGLMFKHECPIEKDLPIWLTIYGVLFSGLGLSIILPAKLASVTHRQDDQLLDFPLIASICMLLSFMWLIRG